MEYDLNRFVTAQSSKWGGYETALSEIHNWQKTGHWIWYVFPQLKGLGRSYNSEFYGISGRDEAAAYLAHPVLGERLREITTALLSHTGKTALDILGYVDAQKVKSCMKLFDCISPDDIFADVLTRFYNGSRCHRSIV